MQHTVNIAFIAPVLLFLSVNILLLDIVIFSRRGGGETTTVASRDIQVSSSEKEDGEFRNVSVQISPSPAFISSAGSTFQEQLPATREFYVPLGSGKAKGSDWVSLPSAEAYIDTDRYPPIRQAYFETYLTIPTGNGQMFAKLFNVTDKHDVWFSEVSSIGHEVTRREVPITLETGSKLYRVMVKGTLPYEVSVENARIKIVTY